jgi:hypothetical protein
MQWRHMQDLLQQEICSSALFTRNNLMVTISLDSPSNFDGKCIIWHVCGNIIHLDIIAKICYAWVMFLN